MRRKPIFPAEIATLADLVQWLGDVPLDRICMNPPPGRATERDVLAARCTPERWLCELVGGVLIRKAHDFSASVISGHLLSQLLDMEGIRGQGAGLASVTGFGGLVSPPVEPWSIVTCKRRSVPAPALRGIRQAVEIATVRGPRSGKLRYDTHMAGRGSRHGRESKRTRRTIVAV